jgi:succinate-acetate transporter protein
MSYREGIPARVFLRPIGSPLALGMAGLVGASLVVSGLELGWIASNQRGGAGLMLVAFAFPLQFAASLLAFAARDGAAGTALGILAGTWLATGLTYLSSGADATSGALGLLLLASAAALACTAAGTATGKLVPALIFVLVALRFAGAGIHELGGGEFWQDAAGIVGLVVVALAGYTVAAAVLEDARGSTVLPLARRERVEQEPGVRAQL